MAPRHVGLLVGRAIRWFYRRDARVEIGKPQTKTVVEPIRDPVPAPAPRLKRGPARPTPSRKEPVRR
jgi:hypothetical protein